MLSIDAQCCSILSFTGIVFLTIMGYLLQVQPLYIKGIEDNIAAAKGCYEGGEIMMMMMMMSMMMMMMMMMMMVMYGDEYDDHDDDNDGDGDVW